MITPVVLLFISNIFMTYAWYGHLRDLRNQALWIAILLSWSVALLEYCFQVPANRLGSQFYSLGQLKIIQEVITMIVFACFALFYLDVPLTRNYFYASICLIAAAYFIFRDGVGS